MVIEAAKNVCLFAANANNWEAFIDTKIYVEISPILARCYYFMTFWMKPSQFFFVNFPFLHVHWYLQFSHSIGVVYGMTMICQLDRYGFFFLNRFIGDSDRKHFACFLAFVVFMFIQPSLWSKSQTGWKETYLYTQQSREKNKWAWRS